MSEQLPNASGIVPRRSYFVRHWRGELTLADSLWRNGFGGGLLLGIVEYVVADLVLSGGNFQLLPGLLICIMLVNTAFLIWVGGGVWRSANRYQGSRVWAILAQATIILGGAVFVLRSGLLLAVITGLLGPAR
jgi:hypothetical protein